MARELDLIDLCIFFEQFECFDLLFTHYSQGA